VRQIFVNDSNFNIMNNGRENKISIIKRVQAMLKEWHSNLQLTGRQLKLEKCYWTLMSYN